MLSAVPAPAAPRILILSHACWEGLSRLPAMLHAAGASVEVFGPAGNYPSLSRHVTASHCAPAAMDAYLQALREFLAKTAPHDWIVIGDDTLWYALAAHRTQSWVQDVIQNAVPLTSLDMVVSKIHFSEKCIAAGIRMPAFRVCHSLAEAQDAAAVLGFPLVLKEAQGYAGLSVQILHTPESLAAADFSEPRIVQAFIRGKTLSACVLYQHGVLAGMFSYYRSRTWGSLGPSAAIRFKVFDGLTEMAQKLGQLSGFHGLCGLDLIESEEDGQWYLLEQNFRPTLTMDAGHLAGVDLTGLLPLLWSESSLPANLPRLQNPASGQLEALFPQDFFRAIDERRALQIAGWLLRPWRWRWQEPAIMALNLRIAMRKLFDSQHGTV